MRPAKPSIPQACPPVVPSTTSRQRPAGTARSTAPGKPQLPRLGPAPLSITLTLGPRTSDDISELDARHENGSYGAPTLSGEDLPKHLVQGGLARCQAFPPPWGRCGHVAHDALRLDFCVRVPVVLILVASVHRVT